MLNTEQIATRLASAMKLKPWTEDRLARLNDLEGSARAIGYLLLGRDASGKTIPEADMWTAHHQAVEQLAGLDEAHLLALGDRLFPQFADVFRAAWALHARLPIQIGYIRKPFRAPGRADLLLHRRRRFLASMLTLLKGYDQDIAWLAAHAAHLGFHGNSNDTGILLAAAIELGGERGRQVEQILRDSAAGTHEVGQFGRHVVSAMLIANRPDCWEFMQNMLLAAQRQEGLRQVILESVDFSHPDAFRRMLRTIDENHLVRFSATVRAADVWLGLQFDSVSAKQVSQILHSIAQLLEDESARQFALVGDDAEQAFYALWAIAFEDMDQAVEPAKALLAHARAEVRYVALQMLAMLGLEELFEIVVPLVDDLEPCIAGYAAMIGTSILNARMNRARRQEWDVEQVRRHGPPVQIPPKGSGDLFERMERLHARLPEKPKPAKALVWPWVRIKITRPEIADALITALGDRPAGRLLPYLRQMTVPARAWTASLVGRMSPWDATTRQAMLDLIGDAAGGVREAAVRAVRNVKITREDLPTLEPLLTRKASDLRRGVLSLILSLDDATVLASAERLLAGKTLPQRLGGLDLLVQLCEAGRTVDATRAAAGRFRAARETLERDEEVYLEKLLGHGQHAVSYDDALGLSDPTRRTPPALPKPQNITLCTKAAAAMIQSLDDLIHTHRDTEVVVKTYARDSETQLLGSIPGFNSPRQAGIGEAEALRPKEELPLHKLWFEWWNGRPAELRDADGLEGLRACFTLSMMYMADQRKPWQKEALSALYKVQPGKLRYTGLVHSILNWLVEYHVPDGAGDFALNGLESLLAAIPAKELETKTAWGHSFEFREFLRSCQEIQAGRRLAVRTRHWTRENARPWYGLMRWIDEPGPKIPRHRPDFATELLPAFDAGIANEQDLLDDLLGPHEENYGYRHFMALKTASSMLRRGTLSPKAEAVVRRAIDRVLAIELRRGESETPATDPAQSLEFAGHTEALIAVLQAIGRDPKLQRTSAWGEASKGKGPVFSHLIRVTFPHKDETPAGFAAAMQEAAIGQEELLAVAFYAPQWARYVEAAIRWPLFEEAVWWFHAHTKDQMWRVEVDTRQSWNASIRKLTPLSLEELMDGAVDVAWFRRVYAAIGPRRWTRLSQFSKYASGGSGHMRAQLFADALLGRAKRKELAGAIAGKRKQDAARAIGLVPIDRKSPKKDVLERYRVLQDFVRTSRQFGSQRQASEKLAARIGQENLARTAGYPDPIRLQWSMEGLATSDLTKGPVTVAVKDITVSLAMMDDGLPEISVARKGKPLKSIPPEAKKNPRVQELAERKSDLRRSASRMRQSLEQAMCRGDRFSREELAELMQNVVLRPMLERLVFVGDSASGYPVNGGNALRDYAGSIKKLSNKDILRLAHPIDLLKGRRWTRWQQECFAAERVQPFKQIFRELYVPADQEKADMTFSRRYAGQQVNPRQALALLAGRGWVTAPEAGVFRMFPEEQLVAWIEFMESFYTPADVEGLTLEKVRFARRGSPDHVPVEAVPPRLFSEAMRDVDLIVSVAHRGNVDPEASASTVELRSALLRETLQLLNLKNVSVDGSHARIKGTLSDYSVHLGSATAQMLPGGALFIIPVHSQHRGRLFLPFADDDPKTAEIISKVLLLARDEELKDPNLLEQIRSRF